MMQPGRCATLALLNMEVKEATCWGAGKTPWRVKTMGFPACFSHGSHLLGCQQNTPRSLSVKWQKIAGGGLPLCLSRCTSKKTAHSDPGNILEDERHCVSFIPLTTFWYLSLFAGLLASGGGCHGSWGEQKTTTKKIHLFQGICKRWGYHSVFKWKVASLWHKRKSFFSLEGNLRLTYEFDISTSSVSKQMCSIRRLVPFFPN